MQPSNDYVSELTESDTISTDSDNDWLLEEALWTQPAGPCIEPHDDKYVCDACLPNYLQWLEQDE